MLRTCQVRRSQKLLCRCVLATLSRPVHRPPEQPRCLLLRERSLHVRCDEAHANAAVAPSCPAMRSKSFGNDVQAIAVWPRACASGAGTSATIDRLQNGHSTCDQQCLTPPLAGNRSQMRPHRGAHASCRELQRSVRWHISSCRALLRRLASASQQLWALTMLPSVPPRLATISCSSGGTERGLR